LALRLGAIPSSYAFLERLDLVERLPQQKVVAGLPRRHDRDAALPTPTHADPVT